MISSIKKSSQIGTATPSLYTPGDFVESYTLLNVVDQDSGSGYICKAQLFVPSSPVINAEFRLYLFSSVPGNVGNNMDAMPLIELALQNCIGYIDFICEAINGAAYSQVLQPNISFQLPLGRDIYGILVAQKAYLPTLNKQIFNIILDIDQY